MMAVRTRVLQELLGSERWSQRLESAETMEQVTSVVEAFCRENKKAVVRLPPDIKQTVPVAAA